MFTNLDYYRIFYYVAKYHNFTRAADALLTSQPTVTRTVKNLENDLGCRLLYAVSAAWRSRRRGRRSIPMSRPRTSGF
ncbi:MAG: LysR family transcriptional regulator [Christensenellaceae bacterium]